MVATSSGWHQLDSEIDQLKRAGWANKDIAIQLDVTRQYVSSRVHSNPAIYRSARDRMRQLWPVQDNRFIQSHTERCVREHLVYMLGGADALATQGIERLSGFYGRLYDEHLIAVFDPVLWPNGWALVERNRDDRRNVFRRNQYVRPPDNFTTDLYKLPKVLPDEVAANN